MPSSEELLAEILATAREQLRWQRAAVLPRVRDTIERALSTTPLRRAFEMCDGERQSAEIAATLGVSKQAVSGWTRRWRDLGIAYEVEGRRVKQLISLNALGLAIDMDGVDGQPKQTASPRKPGTRE